MLLAMGGIMVILDESQIMLYIVSAVIEKFGSQKYKLMYILTAVMMVMGSTVSFYDQCGIFIPLALGLAFAVGWDSLVGIGLSFLPIAMGFAVCTINPIVIGIPQTIAGLPINSGLWLRVILLVAMYLLYVNFLVKYAKKVEADPTASLSYKTDDQIRAMFPANSDPEVLKNRKIKRGVILFAASIAIIFLYTFASMAVTSLASLAMPVMLIFLVLGTFVGATAAGTMKFGAVLKSMATGAKITLPAALVIFLIAGIRQIVINGQIMDTLLYYCYEGIQGTSPYVAVFMVLAITMAMELVIGSASAKAFLLLPLLLPLGNMVGLTSQTIVQAYIYGDGFCNAFYPTSNMVMLITGTIGISFSTWYRFTILNLTYSSCRMASCRLTCAQVESIIKTGKAQASFKPLKVSDLIEAANHCECVDIILQHVMEPLTQTMIKNLHRRLFAGTVDKQNGKVTAGAYRKSSTIIKGRKVPPVQEIAARMSRLIDDYEKAAEHSLRDILSFHVALECIAPFDDGNGRVGRLILFKECLRHGVAPFILDDKRRTRYLQGLREWDEDPWILMEVVSEAQQRYSAQIELQKLKASELRYQRLYHRDSE